MVRTYVKWCRILWHAAKRLFWLKEMQSDMTELNNQSHLQFDVALGMHELKSLIWKLHCFWQLFSIWSLDISGGWHLWTSSLFCLFNWRWFWYEWAYDDFALSWKNASIRFENACLFTFCLKRHSRPHFHLYFIFDHWFFMVTAGRTKSVFLAPVKIVVNFLHRVCTMLQLICTFTLS